MTIVDSETLPSLHKDEDGVFVSDFILNDKFVELYAEGIYPVTIYLTPTELVVLRNLRKSNPRVVVRRHILGEVVVSADIRVLNGIKVEDPLRTMLHYVYQLRSEKSSVREWLEAISKCKSVHRHGHVTLEDPFFDGAMGMHRSSPTHEFSSTVRERCVEGPAPSSVEPGPYIPAAFNGYAPVIASGNGGTLPRVRRRLLSAAEPKYCTLPRKVGERARESVALCDSVTDAGEAVDGNSPSSESPTPPIDLGSPLRHHTIRKGRLHARSISSQGMVAQTATGSPPSTFLLPSRPIFKSKSLPKGVMKPPSNSDGTYNGSVPKSPVARMMHTVHRYFSSPNGSRKANQLDNAAEQNRDSPQRRRLHHYRARDVAEQLTDMDAKLMKNIKPNEIEDEAWTSKQKNECAPNVMAMVKSFNRLALLVPTEILEETTPLGRAKVISKYIKIASECYHLHNYNSLKSVLAGLQCTPIFRLTKTWKEVPRKHKRKFKQLCAIMSEENNWQLYREKLDKHLADDTPCIPFLGLFLTQIIQHGSYKVIRRARELNKSSSFSSYSVYRTRRLKTENNSDSSLVSSRSVPSSPVAQTKVSRQKNSLSGHFQLNSGAVASDSSESAEEIVGLKKKERSNGSSDKSTPLSSHSWSLFSPAETDLSDLGFVSQEPKSDTDTASRSLELDDICLSPKADSPSVKLSTSPTMESVVSGTAPTPQCPNASAESLCGTMTEDDSLTRSNDFGSRPSLDSVFGNAYEDELRHEDIHCEIRSENGECCPNDAADRRRHLVERNRCSTPLLAVPKTAARRWRQQDMPTGVIRKSSDCEVKTPYDPQRLLERYITSASKCSAALRCSEELQSMLEEGEGTCNSERQNYQLSLEREPIHL